MVKRKSTKGQNNILQNIHIKNKDRVTRTPLKPGGELRCCGRVSSYCSTCGTRCVNLVTNPVISDEWGKDREVFTTSGAYPWSFVTQIFHNGQPSHGGDRKAFEMMTQLNQELPLILIIEIVFFWVKGRMSESIRGILATEHNKFALNMKAP